MVNKVSSSHDLSCVFVYFCNIHLYLEHTTEFVDFYFSVPSVFYRAYSISIVNTLVSAITYLVFCSRLQHLKSFKQVSPSYTLSCVFPCVP